MLIQILKVVINRVLFTFTKLHWSLLETFMGVDSKRDHHQKCAWRCHLWFLVSVSEQREDHISMPLKPRALETRASSLNRVILTLSLNVAQCLSLRLGLRLHV